MISAPRWRFARSPVGPSQHQLWDVKTVGVSDAHHANFRVPPADQRAQGVPGDYYRRAAVECGRDWNGTLPGSVGAFEGYIALHVTSTLHTTSSSRGRCCSGSGTRLLGTDAVQGLSAAKAGAGQWQIDEV